MSLLCASCELKFFTGRPDICTSFSVVTVEIHYPLKYNWKMCLLKREQNLAKNATFSEDLKVSVAHYGKSGLWQLFVKDPDRDDSPTVLHQSFFTDDYLPLLRNTYGESNGGSIRHSGGSIDVTANGTADPDRVLLRIKGIEDLDRSKSFKMELNHTGDGTRVYLHAARWMRCNGPSCGTNGLNGDGHDGKILIMQELYVNGWSATDKVREFAEYRITSFIASCNRVGKLQITTCKQIGNRKCKCKC